MKSRLILCVLLGLVLVAASAFGQTYPPQGGYPSNGAAQPAPPDQPVQPQNPTLIRRPLPAAGQAPAAQQPPAPPFPPLTPQEEAQLDRVLQQWEQRNGKIKRFDCKFYRFTYDAVFGKPDQPKSVDVGVIKYGAPDRGLFRVEKTEDKDRKLVPIEDARAEHWLSDGKSIYEYNYRDRKVIEHRLPPEMQGKDIVNSPLPFLFNSKAENLKRRYFIHLIAPPPGQEGKICLEAYPRFQRDAADFHHAQFMINPQDMSPHALKLIDTNAKDSRVFSFFEIAVNPTSIFQQDPFRPSTPWHWDKVLDDAPAPQARRVPNARPLMP